jgi:hypothetical protein
MQDVKLIWLWEKWKQSIADELECDAVAADRAHARTQAIEREIAETRAEGLVGIGIQFGYDDSSTGISFSAATRPMPPMKLSSV